MKRKQKVELWLAVAIAALVIGGAGPVGAQTKALMHMKAGQTLEAAVTSVGPSSVTFALGGGTARITRDYAEIDWIEWPEPSEWVAAKDAFQRGEYAGCRELAAKIAKAPAGTTFAPAPGNFADRALRLAMECERRLRAADRIASLAKSVRWNLLPPVEREVSTLIRAWVALGRGNWDELSAALQQSASTVDQSHPDYPELAFLKARLLSHQGDAEGALAEYALCYGLPADDPGLAGDALKEAILLMHDDQKKQDQLAPMVRLYAAWSKNGGLWEGAPASLTTLLNPPAADGEAGTGQGEKKE